MGDKNDQILDDFEIQIEASYKHTSASLVGKWCAIVSFVIGTILLILGLYDFDSYIFLGMYFVALAILGNILVLIQLLFLGRTPQEKYVNRKMALRMLINIPIAIFYFYLFIKISFPSS